MTLVSSYFSPSSSMTHFNALTSLQCLGSTQNDSYSYPSRNPDPKSPGRGSSEIKETSWDLCDSSGTGARAGVDGGVTGQEDLLFALRETLGKQEYRKGSRVAVTLIVLLQYLGYYTAVS